MAVYDTVLSALLFITPLLHLVAAPYTKVEESFNIQAVHDILVYGTPTRDVSRRLPLVYDHFSFPGAVPRSFVGAVILAGLGQPLVALAGFARAQFVTRALLGLFNGASLLVFHRALREAFGAGAARWWVVLLVSQFHVAYYLTRTLPNMFAFGLTTLAMACLLPKTNPSKEAVRTRQAIGLLVLATTIFRSEIAILLAATGLQLLALNRISLRALVPLFLGTFLAALLLSVPVDSYFWQQPLWPELWGFYYNAVLGSSSEWGVSPWHWYFTSALPRLLLNPLAIPLIVFALFHPATSRQVRALVVPSLAFVAVYSVQPHKETRFIFYVVPALTAAAAIGANYITTRRAKSTVYLCGTFVIALSVASALASSAAMLLLSSLNYPGGDALAQLYALTRHDPSATIHVHADVLTCMTGLTLFGQNPAGLHLALDESITGRDPSWPVYRFDKTEDKAQFKSPRFWERFDYALMEDPSEPLGDWDIVGVVHGYSGIELLRPHAVSHASDADEPIKQHGILGLGARLAATRDFVRKYTGGWWVGPRMSPRIHIMKQKQAHRGENVKAM